MTNPLLSNFVFIKPGFRFYIALIKFSSTGFMQNIDRMPDFKWGMFPGADSLPGLRYEVKKAPVG